MNFGENNDGGHKKLPPQPSKSGKVQLKIGFTPSERGPIRLVKFVLSIMHPIFNFR